MKLPYYLLTVFIGIVLTVHLAMNGKVGAVLNNARVGNALFWCIGAVMALLIGFSGVGVGGAETSARDKSCIAYGRRAGSKPGVWDCFPDPSNRRRKADADHAGGADSWGAGAVTLRVAGLSA